MAAVTCSSVSTGSRTFFTSEVVEKSKQRQDVKLPDYNNFRVTLESPRSIEHIARLSSSKKTPTEDIAQRLRPLDSVLEAARWTPMVNISRFAKLHGLCDIEILAKCELFSPGGSVKDRIAIEMVREAESDGDLRNPGDCLIEATSGNTGIGLAMVSAVKNYNLCVTMPEKMSQEKERLMKAAGATIIRTPTEAMWNDPDSHCTLAYQIRDELRASGKNAVALDQYKHRGNPIAHFDGTGSEILEQTEGRVNWVFLTAGTGGTVAGVGKRIKSALPNCVIVGVDPEGSVLRKKDPYDYSGLKSYHVEGIGYDFHPSVLNFDYVDEWAVIEDEGSFQRARELIRSEGIFCGGSSGSVLSGMLQYRDRFKKGDCVVVVLPDSVRNYMDKFLSDEWMVMRGFLPGKVLDKAVAALNHTPGNLIPLTKETMEKYQPPKVFRLSTRPQNIGALYEATMAHLAGSPHTRIVDIDGVTFVSVQDLILGVTTGSLRKSASSFEAAFKDACWILEKKKDPTVGDVALKLHAILASSKWKAPVMKFGDWPDVYIVDNVWVQCVFIDQADQHSQS